MIQECRFCFKASTMDDDDLVGVLAPESSDKRKVDNELSAYKFLKLCRGTVVATIAGNVQVA